MSFRALNVGGTGMISYGAGLNVTGNNLANINTTGFKTSRANFSSLMSAILTAPGNGPQGASTTPSLGVSFGDGVQVGSTQLNFREGPLVATGRPTDVAIGGEGFFTVADDAGNQFYTRAGNFTTNSNGQLVLSSGSNSYTVQPQINIPADATNVGIAADGTVTVEQNGQTTVVGQIQAARFINPEGLQQIGSNLYSETGASGAAEIGQFGQNGFGVQQQGFLEGSNVETTEELVTLIADQRAYELNATVVQAANENLKLLATLNG